MDWTCTQCLLLYFKKLSLRHYQTHDLKEVQRNSSGVNNENDLFRSSKIMTYGGHSSEKELLMTGAGQGGYNTGVTGVSGGGPESNI